MSTLKHYFIAVPIPKLIKKVLAEWSDQLKELPFDYKEWVYEADFHVTLKFLGGVSEEQVKALSDDLHQLTRSFSTFKMKGKGAGTFGRTDAPRVLWASTESDPELFDWQKQIDKLCTSHGFHAENRPYRPHITIAKKWRGGALQLDRLPAPPLSFLKEWIVDHIVLYTVRPSELPKYQRVETFPFGSGVKGKS
ncbi:RNA 2',3'-cyclic phosphodiesterase [Pullulanibacillus sp. KACC 23026]|uniref:RNA 2',3'-cyclic phosphodiesterase n=1 Tax=Pullulanibacillus sp. KACC 23026 TaxID=3028315 RepID=UPI0023AF4DC6|nr:RNA 2',3'-cyclic phosphodiesterase [Pullulanibacillus sp. KACC 23026]WEG13856.1 RNA 2',3'-cyclic phosphodiesterase [Pullulanibacillus sp. KACC 23026]